MMKRIKFVRYDKGEGNGFFLLKDGKWNHSNTLDWLFQLSIAAVSCTVVVFIFRAFHSC